MADAPPFTIFIHVPKTAGTSFKLAMIETFGTRLAWFTNILDEHTQRTGIHHFTDFADPGLDLRRDCAMLGGHFHYPQIPAGLRQGALLTALIREPVDRALSFYAYLKDRTGDRLAELTAGKTLNQALDVKEFAHVIRNQQSRFLFGAADQRDAVLGTPGQRMLIGKTAAAGTYLDVLGRHLGQKLPPLKSVNVSDAGFKAEIARQPGFAEAVERIRALAQADIALYESFDEVLETPARAALG